MEPRLRAHDVHTGRLEPAGGNKAQFIVAARTPVRQEKWYEVTWPHIGECLVGVKNFIYFTSAGQHIVEDDLIPEVEARQEIILNTCQPAVRTGTCILLVVSQNAVGTIAAGAGHIRLANGDTETIFLDDLLIELFYGRFGGDHRLVGNVCPTELPASAYIQHVVGHVGIHKAKFKIAVLNIQGVEYLHFNRTTARGISDLAAERITLYVSANVTLDERTRFVGNV